MKAVIFDLKSIFSSVFDHFLNFKNTGNSGFTRFFLVNERVMNPTGGKKMPQIIVHNTEFVRR
jgi:hypothetical protein